MVKLLIVSDIHSNMDALEEILKKEREWDRIYCAGDLVDVGFHPKEVLDCVRANKIVTVKGNHDELVVRTYRSGKHLEDVPPAELTWPIVNARQLDEADIAYLENLPDQVDFQIGDIAYSMRHMFKGYDTIVNLHEFTCFWDHHTKGKYEHCAQKRMIFGHTHRQSVTYVHNDCLWMNPGSVGYNREDDPSAVTPYITITDGVIDMKQLAHGKWISRAEKGRRFAEIYQN